MTTIRNNTPPSTTGGALIAKVVIGLILGLLLGFALFLLLSIVGNSLNVLVASDPITGGGGSNPLLSIVMLIITFVTTFVGLSIIAAAYNMLYGDEYYDLTAMFRYVLITNVVIFLFLAPVYLVYMNDVSSLFFVMALHVALGVYVTLMQLDMMINPHYSISSSIGATFGLVSGMLLYVLIISAVSGPVVQDSLHRYVILPPVLMYTIIPLGQGIWKMIYTRWYETGSDALYLGSPSELQDTSTPEEEVAIDM